MPFHFPECNESVSPYAVGTHRHTPEIEQVLGDLAGGPVSVLFTPHLMPMDRGILSTIYARPVRAFSHGCIRTQYVRDFAAVLLQATGQWDRAAIDRAVEAGRTVSARLAAPIPVYIAYFTAAGTNDGNIVTYADIYGRDSAVRAALNRGGGTATASR